MVVVVVRPIQISLLYGDFASFQDAILVYSDGLGEKKDGGRQGSGKKIKKNQEMTRQHFPPPTKLVLCKQIFFLSLIKNI